jgi:hypothetical protein
MCCLCAAYVRLVYGHRWGDDGTSGAAGRGRGTVIGDHGERAGAMQSVGLVVTRHIYGDPYRERRRADELAEPGPNWAG